MNKETADRLLAKVAHDYDVIADSFSATRKDVWPEMEHFKSFVQPGDRVLDLGCGNGRAYQLFAGKAIEYEGLDASANLIEHAKKNVNDLLATFRVGSMTTLPYEDGSFDAVLAIASLHHIPSRAYRRQTLREIRRVLKPGGSLLMTNWARWKPANAGEQLRAFVAKIFGGPNDFGDVFIRWQRGGKDLMRYYHAFTRRGLEKQCRQAGLQVTEGYYVAGGAKVPWWKGDNIVTVCKKESKS